MFGPPTETIDGGPEEPELVPRTASEPTPERTCSASVRKLAAANSTMVPMPPEAAPESERRTAFDRLMDSLEKKVAAASVGRPVVDTERTIWSARTCSRGCQATNGRSSPSTARSCTSNPRGGRESTMTGGRRSAPRSCNGSGAATGRPGLAMACAIWASPAPTASACSGSGSQAPERIRVPDELRGPGV